MNIGEIIEIGLERPEEAPLDPLEEIFGVPVETVPEEAPVEPAPVEPATEEPVEV